MNLLRAFDRFLAKSESVVLVVFLGAMVILAFLQVVLRNVFGTGMVWADTLVRHLLLWAGFFGGSIAAFEGRHISIDALTKYLPDRWRYIAGVLTNLFGGVVCYYLARAAWTFVQSEMEAGGEFLFGLPGYVAMVIIPIGYFLLTVHFVLKVVENAADAVKPPQQEGAH
jgi:TRAP-type C4-dicarboxylate transport system permease small subunit